MSKRRKKSNKSTILILIVLLLLLLIGFIYPTVIDNVTGKQPEPTGTTPSGTPVVTSSIDLR